MRTNVLSLDAQYRLTVAIDPGTTPNALDLDEGGYSRELRFWASLSEYDAATTSTV
jgi:hypothetical protein